MIISVASGKGGTGKTLVATSLAVSLKDRFGVQVLDCDVEEPNAHIFRDESERLLSDGRRLTVRISFEDGQPVYGFRIDE